MKRPKLTYSLITLAVLIAILLVYVASKPAHFDYERTAQIAAPPATVFDEVNDLHKWNAWSPYMDLDPNVKQTFSGPAAGVGASMHWAGNSKAGEGTMTIVESRPHQLIRLRLDFIKPLAVTDEATFTFMPQGNLTSTTWAMEGDNPFLFKLVSTFVNMDKMVGSDFEKGLGRLKKVSESQQ